MNEIILKQSAEIKHDLFTVGKMVDERLDSLNIDNLIATADTIKSMKNLRAELNAEFKEYEEQRKAVKNLVIAPYQSMEEIYKVQVTEKYTEAIGVLKDKIDEHELKIKIEKQETVEAYFEEMKDFSGIDFVSFKDTKIRINLSTSIKKYREDVDAFFKQTQDDLILIDTQEHQAEILTEYKKDLNCSRAIKEVADRKAAERIEKERLELQEKQRRHTALLNNAFVANSFSNAYVHALHKDLILSFEDVKTRSSIEFDALIKDFERILKERATVTAPTKIAPPPTAEPQQQEIPKLVARFEVEGTMEQLQALKQFIIDNKLNYKNI